MTMHLYNIDKNCVIICNPHNRITFYDVKEVITTFKLSTKKTAYTSIHPFYYR